jgi:1-phosphofructokinase
VTIDRNPRVALLTPSPILTVSYEQSAAEPELHLHAGGQGFWVARMVRSLGVGVAFCAPLGGEVGMVLRVLLEGEGLDLRAVESSHSNGAYVHRRGRDDRELIGETRSFPLTRHEVDALYAATLTAGLEAGLAILTGPRSHDVIEADFYRRLALDLRHNGCRVIADLSGPSLAAALEGGVDLLHLSERELFEHVGDGAPDKATIVESILKLRGAGASDWIVSCGSRPAIASVEGELFELSGPVFEALEARGPGDSMFAAIAASLAKGLALADALRMGAAAGALNAVRRGLGSGSRADIERLAQEVTLRPLQGAAGPSPNT